MKIEKQKGVSKQEKSELMNLASTAYHFSGGCRGLAKAEGPHVEEVGEYHRTTIWSNMVTMMSTWGLDIPQAKRIADTYIGTSGK